MRIITGAESVGFAEIRRRFWSVYLKSCSSVLYRQEPVNPTRKIEELEDSIAVQFQEAEDNIAEAST